MPFECAQQLAVSRFPELQRVITAPACQRPALRIKRHTQDRVLVPLQRAEQFHARRQLRPPLFDRSWPLPLTRPLCHAVKAFYAAGSGNSDVRRSGAVSQDGVVPWSPFPPAPSPIPPPPPARRGGKRQIDAVRPSPGAGVTAARVVSVKLAIQKKFSRLSQC